MRSRNVKEATVAATSASCLTLRPRSMAAESTSTFVQDGATNASVILPALSSGETSKSLFSELHHGRGAKILKMSKAIKKQNIRQRRLQHQFAAAQTQTESEPEAS